MLEKPCIRCSKVLPLSEFYVHAQMGDGHLNKCKACCKEQEKLRRAAKPEFLKAYEKTRSKTPKRKALAKEISSREKHRTAAVVRSRQYRGELPAIYDAHKLVNNHLRDGKITQLPCEICGKTTSVRAHHDDYAKPLDVRWLCAVHHREWHDVNGRGLNWDMLPSRPIGKNKASITPAEERDKETRC